MYLWSADIVKFILCIVYNYIHISIFLHNVHVHIDDMYCSVHVHLYNMYMCIHHVLQCVTCIYMYTSFAVVCSMYMYSHIQTVQM